MMLARARSRSAVGPTLSRTAGVGLTATIALADGSTVTLTGC